MTPTARLQTPASLLFALSVMASGGCSMMKAATNVRAAWAVQEPAPMTVVVHRAHAAREASEQVDRLLTATPVSDDSAWPSQVHLTESEVKELEEELGASPLYEQKNLKIVHAAVWAQGLSRVEPAEMEADDALEMSDEESSGGEAPIDSDAATKEAKETEPVVKVALDADKPVEEGAEKDASETEEASAETDATETTEGEAPETMEQYASLIEAISPALGEAYGAIQAKLAMVAALEAALQEAEAAEDADGLSPEDARARKDAVAALEAQLDAADAEIEPLQVAFVARCEAEARGASVEAREHYGEAVVNLLQAARDAEVANSAALLRYPVALPGMKDALVQSAKANASDYLFERTGHRIQMSKEVSFAPAFENGETTVAINGMTPSDLGEVSMTELTRETTKRTLRFSRDALILLAYTNRTERRLEFQMDVLEGIVDGFESAGYDAPLATFQSPRETAKMLTGLFKTAGSAAVEVKAKKKK